MESCRGHQSQCLPVKCWRRNPVTPPWTEQSTHKRTLWWAAGEEWSKASHSEHCHAVGHLEVDVLDFKYTRRVNNLLIFFFFGASHLLLTFRILYNDHLLLGETGFHFTLFFFALFKPHLICYGCMRSFVELCRSYTWARSFCSIDSISQT